MTNQAKVQVFYVRSDFQARVALVHGAVNWFFGSLICHRQGCILLLLTHGLIEHVRGWRQPYGQLEELRTVKLLDLILQVGQFVFH